LLRNWLSRHRNPTNFLLHVAGVPMMILAIPSALMGYWLLAVGMLLGSYALQLLGHVVEGNRSGEEELLRKLLKRPRRS
jgi:hypothetical protein